MSAVFLLGSGASKAAGLPSVQDITGCICDGLHFKHNSQDRFELLPTPVSAVEEADFVVRRSTAVVNCVLPLIRLHRGAKSNYEDVYYVISQVVDHLTGQFENPALLPFVAAIQERFTESEYVRSEYGADVGLLEVLGAARYYIRDAVWQLLSRSSSPSHLAPWAAAIKTLGSECPAIVSLNHDELAREALRDLGVEFEDGFVVDALGVGSWIPSRLDPSGKLRLLHLHGVITWFWTHEEDRVAARRFLLRLEKGDLGLLRPDGGTAMELDDHGPCLSVGTHNKVTGYFEQPFSELYAQLTRLLREEGDVERVVLAGYGGADKGVNLQLSDWMQANAARKIVLVHPDPGVWLVGARRHLASQWPGWVASKRVAHIQARFEELTEGDWIGASRG